MLIFRKFTKAKSHNRGHTKGKPLICRKEDYLMRKSTATTITTCLGIAAAGAALMMSNSGSADLRHKTKRLRRSTGRALRQVGSFIENASYMMK
jgi:hypothetical protein